MTDSDWIKQLQSMMERHEEPVGADLWQDIEARLPEHQASKRVTPAWRRYAAAAVAAAVIGGGGLLWHGGSDNAIEAPAITMTSPEVSAPKPEVLAQNDVVSPDVDAPAASPHIAQAVPVKHATSPANASGPNEPLALADKPTEAAPVQETTENEPPAKQPEEPTEQPVEKPTLGHINVTPNSNATKQTIIMPVNKRPSVSLEFYASNTIKSEESSSNGDWVYMFAQLCDEPTYILFDSIPVAEYYHKFSKHHAPYSLGVSVRLPLNDRLALTSGLVYTRLKSDFSLSDKEQILHYVGVPLGVTYKIWGYKRFNVYAVGGMQTDFNVKASVKNHKLVNDTNIGKDRVQFSALAGPGFQLDLSQDFSIYVEPTARYYFNNGSDIDNYFKDKPWNINFNAGLRLTLQ